MGRNHVLDAMGAIAAQVDNGFCGFHLHPGAGELQAAGAKPGHQPTHQWPKPLRHAPQGQSPSGSLQIADETLYGAEALTGTAGRYALEF